MLTLKGQQHVHVDSRFVKLAVPSLTNWVSKLWSYAQTYLPHRYYYDAPDDVDDVIHARLFTVSSRVTSAPHKEGVRVEVNFLDNRALRLQIRVTNTYC